MILLALFAFLLGLSLGGWAVNAIWDHQNLAPDWMTAFLSFIPAFPGLLALLLLPIHARIVLRALRRKA